MSTVAGDGRSGMLPSLERRGGTWCSRSEEHTSELQSQSNLVCRLLLEKKKSSPNYHIREHAITRVPAIEHRDFVTVSAQLVYQLHQPARAPGSRFPRVDHDHSGDNDFT